MTRPKRPTRHINLNVSAEAGAALDRTANRAGGTFSDSVRRAILVHEYLERQVAEGGRVWVSDGDGLHMREIVLLS